MLSATLVFAACSLLAPLATAAPSSAIEREITSMEPSLAALLELSINGAEKGAAYSRTADFCDRYGHRISGSPNLVSPPRPPSTTRDPVLSLTDCLRVFRRMPSRAWPPRVSTQH